MSLSGDREIMSLSFKQLTIYIALLAIGGGAGIVGSRYLPELQQGLVAADPPKVPVKYFD